ncbi:hypothetical protein Q669_29580 [Labrenzia sp. C1B10]|nr:hypothetical protein Q669_29580 [Labrenzia sp. C1B10]ERS05788.1 hypothetical protein Q675_29145 [Labrenzia sp. C1B70]
MRASEPAFTQMTPASPNIRRDEVNSSSGIDVVPGPKTTFEIPA